MTTTDPDLRYPIGRYVAVDAVTPDLRADRIATVATHPSRLRDAVADLEDAQLDTPYREGGWTVRQLVHHLADSHMNAYIRFKLALTEEQPTIKPYDEGAWATLSDATLPVTVSLTLLDALHARWSRLLDGMAAEEWARTFVHPEQGRTMTLEFALGLYAWHGAHHVAHVTALRTRLGW